MVEVKCANGAPAPGASPRGHFVALQSLGQAVGGASPLPGLHTALPPDHDDRSALCNAEGNGGDGTGGWARGDKLVRGLLGDGPLIKSGGTRAESQPLHPSSRTGSGIHQRGGKRRTRTNKMAMGPGCSLREFRDDGELGGVTDDRPYSSYHRWKRYNHFEMPPEGWTPKAP